MVDFKKDDNQLTYDVPILLIAYKRPDKVARVLESIKKIKPKTLYVACDGADSRNSVDFKAVKLTRKIIKEKIDWDTNLKIKFNKANKGCMKAVSEAISWFFENVDEGIILEDDCLPHKDFFPFCKELLIKYRFDKRVWCITGDNLQNDKWIGDGSYYFSRYNHCWGWASWKRCWVNYDVNISDWPYVKRKKLLNNIFDFSSEIKYWTNIFDSIHYQKKPNTWDYQWTYSCFINGGMTIIPNKALIQNIGFGNDATHTFGKIPNDRLNIINKEETGILPLIHPKYLLRSKEADRYTELNFFSGPKPFSMKWLHKKVKNLSQKVLKIFT